MQGAKTFVKARLLPVEKLTLATAVETSFPVTAFLEVCRQTELSAPIN
jgi:hypothetical protein